MRVGFLVCNKELGLGIVTEEHGATQVVVDFYELPKTVRMVVTKSDLMPGLWRAPSGFGTVRVISAATEK